MQPELTPQAMLPLLRGMFTDAGVAGYDPSSGTGVRCPFCPQTEDSSYIHIGERVNYLGNDAYDASGRYGMDVRGDVTAISFWSETCGHRWALVFGFHKGATFAKIVRLPDDPDIPPDGEPSA